MANILVIDDDPEFLQMMRLLLENRGGHEAVLSLDGEEGLRKALADPPDLAIVDVMMPNVTGYEVCRRLRDEPATATIPIVVLTARGQPVDREAALEAGADEHVAKPVPMTDLLGLVNELLEKREVSISSRLIVLLSLRGGVGVTTLAVNLATALARVGDHDVCLVDLCPSSGHAALQLGLRAQPNWSDLVESGAPDDEAIDARLLRHGSGLHLLASPLAPLIERDLPRTTVEAALGRLGQRFVTIVVDAPSMLNEATMAALEMADSVTLVVTAEPPSIQTALATMRALEEASRGFRVILNQVSPETQLPPGALSRVVKRPIVGSVPFDPAQARALVQGTPLVLSEPDSPLAKAVQQLALDLS